ncbi:hypothetical protein B0J17DRAFT_148326 [Rhizoctonia solani]|nr:hypothetical protein B0J17DRAFT_148326 [Rhizoctonia solani]
MVRCIPRSIFRRLLSGTVDYEIFFNAMIQTDEHDRPQLVSTHEIPRVVEPSLMDRLAIRLRLKKGNKPVIDQAVADGYEFISRNYAPGDQVVLIAWSFDNGDPEPFVKAAETLATHPHDGTSPGDRSNFKSRQGGATATRRIPIHGVAVCDWYGLKRDSMSGWNDELKSRFPPGIEHIICYKWEADRERGCSTRFGPDGSMMSRQIFQCLDDSWWGMWIYCTKHVIYWKEDEIPKWDEHKPVWTRELSSAPSGTQGGVLAEGMKPAGMHRHELRKYQDLPRWSGKISMLVWTSSRV